MAILPKDNNSVSVSGGVSDIDATVILPLIVNHTTGRLKCSATLPDAELTVGSSVINSGTNGYQLYDNNGVLGERAGGSGTVTKVSVATANGFQGTVSNDTTTPAITVNVDATHYLPTTTDQSTWNAKGTGTVTSASVVTANGVSATVSNASTTPAFTFTLGAITPSTINGLHVSNTDGTITMTAGKTLTIDKILELDGTDSTKMTFPASSDTIMGLGAVQSVTGKKTFDKDKLELKGTSTGVIVLSNANTSATSYTLIAPAVDDTIVALAATQTLTNKRITPRVGGGTTYTTDTGTSINGDTQDMFIVTAQAGALKFNNPSGTPTDGQKLIISVASSTTAARLLTWDTAYGATTVALPTTTAATTVTLTIGFIWSASKSLWQCVAVA